MGDNPDEDKVEKEDQSDEEGIEQEDQDELVDEIEDQF